MISNKNPPRTPEEAADRVAKATRWGGIFVFVLLVVLAIVTLIVGINFKFMAFVVSLGALTVLTIGFIVSSMASSYTLRLMNYKNGDGNNTGLG